MDPRLNGSGSFVLRPKMECTRLQSIPEFSDPELNWSPCPSPRPSGSPSVAIRSRSLPGPAGTHGLQLPRTPPNGHLGTPPHPGTPPCAGTPPYSGSPKLGIEREIRILVLGYTGVGKSALVVRYLTKRFIGDYAPYETMCSAQTHIDGKQVKISILDMSWQSHDATDIARYLEWCDGVLVVFSLVDPTSLTELISLVHELHNKIKGMPSVLVGTKSDLTLARSVTQSDIQRLATELKCPYVETSARESHTSSAHAFLGVVHEIRTSKKKSKSKKHVGKNGYSGKLQNIRERLRSIAGEFRQRTNTF